MMELVVTTGAIRRAKLQSNRQHQQTNIHFFTVWFSSCCPSSKQQRQSTEETLREGCQASRVVD